MHAYTRNLHKYFTLLRVKIHAFKLKKLLNLIIEIKVVFESDCYVCARALRFIYAIINSAECSIKIPQNVITQN